MSASVTESHVSANPGWNMPVQLQCTSSMGTYSLICSLTFIGLYNVVEERYEWRQQITQLSLSQRLILHKDGVYVYRSGDVVIVFAYMKGFKQAAWSNTVIADGLPKPPVKFEATCIMQGSTATDSSLEIETDGKLRFRTYKFPVTEDNLWMRGTLVYVAGQLSLSHSISALSTAADSQLVKELWVSTDGAGIVVRTADDVMRRAECRVVSQLSLSRKVDHGDNVISAKVSASPDVSSPVQVTAVSEMGNYTLLVTTDGVGLYDNVSNYYVWRYTAQLSLSQKAGFYAPLTQINLSEQARTGQYLRIRTYGGELVENLMIVFSDVGISVYDVDANERLHMVAWDS